TRGSFAGVTLAINVESREAVDAALDEAVAAGGSLLKPGTEFPFGYGGYFPHPHGHAWGVRWNPRLPPPPAPPTSPPPALPRPPRPVHRARAIVQRRLLELAARLRDETPPIEPGTQAASLLGISGPVGIEIADRGPRRIELWSTRGRIRASMGADVLPADGD